MPALGEDAGARVHAKFITKISFWNSCYYYLANVGVEYLTKIIVSVARAWTGAIGMLPQPEGMSVGECWPDRAQKSAPAWPLNQR
jgi:hypothetical protein